METFNATRRRTARACLAGGLWLCASACLSGCDREGPTASASPGRLEVVNDSASLNARLTARDEPIGIESADTARADAAAPKRAAQVPVLTLTAEVSPPVVDGVALQATCVSLSGGYAFVSYNVRGNAQAGAVDVIQLRASLPPSLKSEMTFGDADISALYFDGSAVHLAEASSDPSQASPAVLERVPVSANLLQPAGASRLALGSYAATSVAVDGAVRYVTTGNTGGLYAIPGLAGAARTFIPLADARWVDFNSSYVAVAQGTPGRIAVFEKPGLTLARTIAFSGADIPESKSTVRILGNKALVAAGTGGVKIFHLVTGKLMASIPRPVVAGLDSSVCVSNSADGAGAAIFISNGEAGVYVGLSASALDGDGDDAAVDLPFLGELKFANLQSANHVAFDGSTLVVACGTGGVKIVNVR
jgi:hypothetical protein